MQLPLRFSPLLRYFSPTLLTPHFSPIRFTPTRNNLFSSHLLRTQLYLRTTPFLPPHPSIFEPSLLARPSTAIPRPSKDCNTLPAPLFVHPPLHSYHTPPLPAYAPDGCQPAPANSSRPERVMTRLVGVRAVCDGCLSAAATVFCVNHRTVLCLSCDKEQHASSHTASHQRVDLASAVTALPFCERCDDAPASVYCESEGITFCDKCDCVSHASHTSPPHCRTPISSTLRHRPVEFRGLPDIRASSGCRGSSSPSCPASTTTELSHLDSTKNGNDRLRPSANPSTDHAMSPHQPHPSIPPRTHHSPRRRSSKSLLKRKHRRAAQRPIHPAPQPRAAPRSLTPFQPLPDVLNSGDISGFFLSHGDISGHFSAFQDGNVPPAPIDPLQSDNTKTFQSFQDHSFSTCQTPLPQDLGMLSYSNVESMDVSGDTQLEGPSGSGKESSISAGSSRRKSPESGLVPRNGATQRLPAGSLRGQQSSDVGVMEAAAAAAAAAGELYLLNSGSSGSTSSREQRMALPVLDTNRGPDPAGVAQAATAAAQSTVAAVDREGTAGVIPSPQEAQAPKSTNLETGRNDDNLQPREGYTTRQMNDARMVVNEASHKESHPNAFAPTRQRFEEISMGEDMRRLENDHGNGHISKVASQIECRFDRLSQDPLSTQPNTDVLGEMTVRGGGEILQRGGHDIMDDLEMPEHEFGMFDSIDLSQFEQSSGGGLGYALSGYGSKVLDSDEG